MNIVMFLKNEPTHYLLCPNSIVPHSTMQWVFYFFQLVPAFLLSFMSVIIYLPPFFPFLQIALENDDSQIIPLCIACAFLFLNIIFGVIAENIAKLFYPKYKEYKTGLSVF